MRGRKGKEKSEMPIVETLICPEKSSRLQANHGRGLQTELDQIFERQVESSEHTGHTECLSL